MKLPLNWLKDFVPVRVSPEKLAQVLTLAGIEVEHLDRGPEVSGVVVGVVESVVKHPNADRLKVCQVRVLAAGEPRTIVCGAPNVAAGQKVAVALPGSVLPSGIEIRPATIRGVESSGMICAADELAMGDDHTGIIVLNSKAGVGEPAGKWLGASDVTFDITVTPNRGDCLSVRGVAREVAVLTKQKLKAPRPQLAEGTQKNGVKISIKDLKGCPQYVARVVEGIRVQPSPVHVQERLRAAGVRPINAVVDATNYVMLELGQPLHAFDTDRTGDRMFIRSAKAGETLVTLDGQSRKLVGLDLVIATPKQVVALAGVMGGQDTEVHERTTRVTIESARFDPARIRLTAQRLNLRSEASNRFEKGIDPALAIEAVDRCAAYIAEWADGVVAKGRVMAGKKASAPRPIVLTPTDVERLLGVRVTAAKVKAALMSLDCNVAGAGARFRVTPPTWRLDLRIAADLVEEIGRLQDYNTLTPTLPHVPQRPPEQAPTYTFAKDIRHRLVAAGLTETPTYSFYSKNLAQQFDLLDQPHAELENPLNPDQALLRRSLMPQLLTVAGKQSATRDHLAIFEIGRCFWPAKSAAPEERMLLGIVEVRKVGDPFLTVKGYVDALCRGLGIADVRYHSSNSSAARITVGTEAVGIIGTVRQKYAEAVKLRKPAAFAEIDLSLLLAQPRRTTKVKPLPLYPSVERDLAFAIPQPVPHAELVRVVRGVDPLILTVRGIDRFALKNGQVSVTLRVTFQSPGTTLTSEDVDGIVEKIAGSLRQVFNAQLRS